jgi:hypothetical protein
MVSKKTYPDYALIYAMNEIVGRKYRAITALIRILDYGIIEDKTETQQLNSTEPKIHSDIITSKTCLLVISELTY